MTFFKTNSGTIFTGNDFETIFRFMQENNLTRETNPLVWVMDALSKLGCTGVYRHDEVEVETLCEFSQYHAALCYCLQGRGTWEEAVAYTDEIVLGGNRK